MSEAPWIRVASTAQLAPGDVIAIEAGGHAMVLARDGDRWFALQRKCPHQGADLSDGIVSRGHLICPQHGWRFAVDTGAHEISPETCLVTFAVRIEGTDVLVDPTPRRPMPDVSWLTISKKETP